MERGYASTTIEAIAVAADVAVQTVYAVFTNKRSILKEVVDVTIAGDDEPVAIAERPGFQAILGERDARRILARWVTHAVALLERTAAVFAMVDAAAAADPVIAAASREGHRGRRANFARIFEALRATGELADEADPDSAVDVMYALVSPAMYRMLVVDRGWPPDRYGNWLLATLESLLLGGSPQPGSARP